jgi:peptide/nickel transport system permease protein
VTGFIVRRVLSIIPVVLGVVTINFVLIHAAPGDPAAILAGPEAPLDYVRELQVRLGLNQPLWQQYGLYVGSFLRGDLGTSFQYRGPVASVILDRLPATLLLSATAFAASVSIGIGLGIMAASARYSALGRVTEVVATILYSIPTFVIGLLLILLFGVTLRLLPVQGFSTVAANYVGWVAVVDVLRHLIMPVVALALVNVAGYLRFSRASLIEALDAAYIRTARAKGLYERSVVLRHAFRNALIPIVTVVGLRMGFLVAGAAVVEIVFGWPGIGLLMYQATFSRDYPLMMGVFVVTAVLVSVANLVVDVAYAVIDPRIHY